MRKIRLLNDVDPRSAQRRAGTQSSNAVIEAALNDRIRKFAGDQGSDDILVLDDVPKRVTDALRTSMERDIGPNNAITAVMADPRKVSISDADYPKNQPSYGEHVVMFNGVSLPVTTQDRSGFKVRHKPNNPNTRIGLDVAIGEFVIRVYRHLDDNNTDFDVQGMALDANGYYDPNSGSTEEGHVMRAAWTEHKERLRHRTFHYGNGPYGVSSVVTEYRFTMDELLKFRSIYCFELDLIVSIEDQFEAIPPHPASLFGNKQMFLQGDPSVDAGLGLQYRLVIVDNARRVKERYVNLNGSVYRVKPTMSKVLRSGAWLIRTEPVEGNTRGKTRTIVEYSTLSKMDEAFHLFASYEEAFSLGDQIKVTERIEQRTKLELARLKQVSAQRDHEFAEFKMSVERERAEWEHERARERMRWEREREQRERAMFGLKERAEEASHRRKSGLEWLKFIPAALTAIGSLVMFIL